MKPIPYFISLCAALVILFSSERATAQIPRNLTVQGILTDSTSRPIPDGIHTITLRLYDKFLGGNILYFEEYTTPVFKGLFNLTLGSKEPLPSSVSFDRLYFVGISYDGKNEIARIPLSSVPYALMAETVPDGSITGAKIADGSITPDKLSRSFLLDLKGGEKALANVVTGTYAVIAGGNNNTASGNYSAMTGGLSNTTSALFSFIGGGTLSSISGQYGANTGGYKNIVTSNGSYSFIGGGNTNTVSATTATIAGGNTNTVSGIYGFIGGGYSNSVAGEYGVNSGGYNNSISSGSAYTFIGGGNINSIGADYGSIAGGYKNVITSNGEYSIIGGGNTNTASGNTTTIAGGYANTSSGMYSFIGGGRSNTASGGYSTLSGGYSNIASGQYSSVLGGYDAAAAADYSVVLGGNGLTLNANAVRTLGFLANTGSRAMTISTPNVVVLGNTDVWIASNDGTTRALKLFSNNLNAAGAYPSTTAKNVAIKAPNGLSADYILTLPPTSGSTGQVLTTDGTGELSWTNGGGGGGGASGSAGGDLTGTYPNPAIAPNAVTSAKIADGSIVNADVSSSAAITYSKLNLTNGIVAGDITSNAITAGKIANNSVDGSKIALGSDATGDIMYYNGTDYVRLAAGSNGNVLTLSSGLPAWDAASVVGLTHFTESVDTTAPNATTPVVRLLATNTATDVDIALTPKGNGALTAQVPDTNSLTGGNKRGVKAVDWQMQRDAVIQVASGNYSTISGGEENTASNIGSTVSGGGYNKAVGDGSTVSGGTSNTASGNQSTISGGIQNTASGESSNVGGGTSNIASYINSTIGGGVSNESSNIGSTVSGGGGNTSSGIYSTVSGGSQNTATQDFSSISGGENNTASGYYSSILGGVNNTNSGYSSTISGGFQNSISGDYSAIGGGENLTLSIAADRSFGFNGNSVNHNKSISIEANNTSIWNNVDMWLTNNDNDPRSLRFYAQYNTAGAFPNGTHYVGFKAPNSIASDVTWTLPDADGASGQVLSTNGSGLLSWNSHVNGFIHLSEGIDTGTVNSTIPAVQLQAYGDDWASIDLVLSPKGLGALSAGTPNAGSNKRGRFAVDWQMVRSAQTQVASGQYSSIGGGWGNTASGDYSTASGGQGNIASSDNAIVSGGYYNVASGSGSSVGGGLQNVSSGTYVTIGGGLGNNANGSYSNVSGGQYNVANGSSTIGGGQYNNTSGVNSTISGGSRNSATGDYSIVMGGRIDTVAGDYSVILGGSGFTLTSSADRSLGFNGNDAGGNLKISIDANNTAVWNNVDMWLTNNDNTPRSLRFYAQYNTAGTFPNGTHYVGFKAPNSIASDVTWTLPDADGANGEALTTNGSGSLSWAAPAASFTVSNAGYLTRGGTNPSYDGFGPGIYGSNTPTDVGVPISTSGTIDAFYVYSTCQIAAISGDNTITATIYKNGSPTSCTVTFTLLASATQGQVIGTFSDVTHSVSVTAGDILSIQWNQSNVNNGAIPYFAYSVHFH